MDVFEWQDRSESTSITTHMLAGSLAGMSQHLSMIPIDNIKTHCQSGKDLSIWQIVNKIYKVGGLSNFYSGSSIVMVGCLPAHAIYFSIYQHSLDSLKCDPEKDFGKFAFVGALSSMFHDLIMTPTQTLKQRLQLARSDDKKIKASDVGYKILKKQGYVAFYRSFPVNYAMNIPFGSLIVLFNQKIKHLMQVKEGDQGLKFYLCGGLAGAIASIPTCPLDVIKTKLNTQYCASQTCEKQQICKVLNSKIQKMQKNLNQAQFKSNRGKLWMQNNKQSISTIRQAPIYRNMFDTAGKIWKQDGILGFFKGLKLRMMIQSVSSGVAWGTYQMVKHLLSPSHKE